MKKNKILKNTENILWEKFKESLVLTFPVKRINSLKLTARFEYLETIFVLFWGFYGFANLRDFSFFEFFQFQKVFMNRISLILILFILLKEYFCFNIFVTIKKPFKILL